MTEDSKKDAEEWKKKLPADVYHVTREKGTEPAGTGKYLHTKETGMYRCSNCGTELFASDAKYDSGTGWPSFTDALPGAIDMVPDHTLGMERTEAVCKKCGAHLGHVFDDGPGPTCQRFCMNSLALDFQQSDSAEEGAQKPKK